MRSFTVTAAVLAASVNADLCSLGSQLIGGNWYCDQVETIQYTNVAQPGTYQRITNMDSTTGACSSTPYSYSGSLGPMAGEISVHLRGPAQLFSMAVYSPGSPKKAKRTVSARHAHGHAEFHAKKDVEEKRDLGDMVTAVIDGQTVSWANNWSGEPTPVADSGAGGDTWVTATINGVEVSWLWGAAAPTPDAGSGDSAPAPPAAPTPEAEPDNLEPQSNAANNGNNNNNSPQPDQSSSYNGDWVRTGYYDAASGTSQGLAFLNHMGGQGSGVFDYVFGNSLSYASPDAKSGSATSQVLANAPLGSNTEIAIFSDKPCTDGSCGYSRDGTVALHGFGGDRKVLLFEVQMPYDGARGFNGDMSALWFLNAEIPRTIQYGKQDCSCWNFQGQCGEFDILEVLDPGNHRTKSTLHMKNGLGDSDWILRPADAPIKVAVVMADSKATIKVLDSSFDFSTTLTNSQIDDIVGGSSGLSSGGLTSVLQLLAS